MTRTKGLAAPRAPPTGTRPRSRPRAHSNNMPPSDRPCMFEVLRCDLGGRTGVLHTAHGTVRTPAFVPVVHPVKQSIPAAEIAAVGFDMVITNAYIAMKRYGREAARRGIHGIIGHGGPVMTDSGGYQVLEYGDVGIDPEDMASYEEAIGTDVAVPLDRPTGMGLPHAEAKGSVDHTLRVSRRTISHGDRKAGARIWAGPVQGGEHFDLVAKSAGALSRCGYRMLALGSPVEFMESYRFADLARMILAARSAMPAATPLHLFGAGHPLTIPLAVALGCDTFDSASYMLYARQDRYIAGDATRRLSDIAEFSCLCPVCSSHTPAELAAISDGAERARRLALHNLYAIKSEVARTRQAIHEGRLWEYVMRKSRAHPRLAEAAAVLAREGGPTMVHTTPAFKAKAVFLFDALDQYRPEVLAYHQAVRAFAAKGKAAVCITARSGRPAYASPALAALERAFDSAAAVKGGAASVQFCQYSPLLGIIPAELSDLYPAAHCVESRARRDPADFPEFAATWEAFMSGNRFEALYCDPSDRFLAHFARRAGGVRRIPLSKVGIKKDKARP